MAKAYPDRGHPHGRGDLAWFSGFVYPAEGNPVRGTHAPWFSLRGNHLYPDRGHPDGVSDEPWFRIA
jgi:hypothetical protein